MLSCQPFQLEAVTFQVKGYLGCQCAPSRDACMTEAPPFEHMIMSMMLIASVMAYAKLCVQVMTSLQGVCGWVRGGSQYRVGNLLIAVRAGHVPPGVAGLIIAASARDKSIALQAVQAAVKQVEALGAQSKDIRCMYQSN